MKLHAKLLSIVLLLSLWIMSFSLSATIYSSAEDSLRINGSVFHDKDSVLSIEVNVYVDNNKYKTIKAQRSNKFSAYLPLNEMVTVEVVAPGYYTKRLIIDTHVSKSSLNDLVYNFDMDLYAEEEMEGVNTSIIDFPVGLIQYQKGKFGENKKYTKQMKSEYMRLLEEAYVSDREQE